MNLFHKPSLSELASLIESNTKQAENYNVIVDYDGEVLIDSDSNVGEPVLNRYKFYFTSMNTGKVTGESIGFIKYLARLFKNLVFCWEKDLSGKMDYQLISNLQNRSFSKRNWFDDNTLNAA